MLNLHFISVILLIMGAQWSECTLVFQPGDSLWPSDQTSSSASKNAVSQEIVPSSDLRSHDRRICIITTAALPWMTGTSVNPLLRAAYLAKDRPKGMVSLLVPWMEPDHQKIAGFKNIFEEPEEQMSYIRQWLNDAGLERASDKLDITFYTGRYHDEFHSIFPMGDITDLVPDDEADVCILEEPEHLNWYRAPFKTKPWTDKFKHVVGIIHTNYLHYASTHKGGYFKEPLLYYVNQGMCRAYTHKVIKLSNALQEFAPEKETTSAVHGVRERYLKQGDEAATRGFTKGVYFVGKLAWPKGLDILFKYMKMIKSRTHRCFHVDIFGGGPHEAEIQSTAAGAGLPVSFNGPKDHAVLSDYKVFVNPSTSEVLCTTVIEALAMGKWVVCPRHPSNEFFYQFPNCLTYETPEEFAANVYWALNADPQPLTAELRHELTWEAATDRLIHAAMLTVGEQEASRQMSDKFALWVHDLMSNSAASDFIRTLAGGRDASGQVEFMKKFGTTSPRSNSDLTELDDTKNTPMGVGKDAAEGSVVRTGLWNFAPWKKKSEGGGDDVEARVIEGKVSLVTPETPSKTPQF